MQNPETSRSLFDAIHRPLMRLLALSLLGLGHAALAQDEDPTTTLDRLSAREQALIEENQQLLEQEQALSQNVETLQERQSRLDRERQQLIDERDELELKMAAAARQSPPFEIQWRATPEYPTEAASQGVEGFVDLEFSLAADGEIGSIRVIDSEPDAVFDQAATDAVSQWIIDNHSGKPITLKERIEFQID